MDKVFLENVADLETARNRVDRYALSLTRLGHGSDVGAKLEMNPFGGYDIVIVKKENQ